VNADDRRILVHRCITAAVRAVHAGALVRASLASGALAGIDRARPPVVLAAGKAAVSMTEHVLDWFDGPVQGGMVSAPRVPGTPLGPLRTFAAGHPHPTDQSVAAAAAALVAVRELTVEDQVVVLLSGGASALLALPAPPVTLADKVAVTHRLLTRGVAIDGLNAVRKHVSLIKGGQLAMATAARTWTLALSVTIPPPSGRGRRSGIRRRSPMPGRCSRPRGPTGACTCLASPSGCRPACVVRCPRLRSRPRLPSGDPVIA
jgi:glycerate-2-kinase